MTRTFRLVDRLPPRLGIAAALGVLHSASFVGPLASWWLQIAVLAALFALAAPSAGQRPRQQALTVWVFAFGWFAGGLAWLHTSMHVYGGMNWLLAATAVALFVAYLSLFPALAVAIATRWGGRPSPSAAKASVASVRGAFAHALAMGGCWGLAEMARGTLFTGFPWLASGYAHVDSPLAGYAPWIGVYGIGALAAVVASLLAAAALPSVPGRPRAIAIGACLAILAAGAALARIAPTAALGPPVSVRLIQGNVAQQMKFNPDRALAAMRDYTSAVESAATALVVLPETAWTLPWHSTPAEIAARILAATGGGEKTVAIGMPMSAREDARVPGRARFTNSVALIGAPPRGGAESTPIAARYDKRHLVPFGEFIPWGFAWFVELMNIPLGEFTRGVRAQPPFEVAGQRFAFNICYEDLFGEQIAESIRDAGGASVLVNVSNIAWFGDSQALPQHLAIARMRTLETGRPMLRATNTGVTAAIDHRGRVIARLPNYEAGVLDVVVQGTGGLTAYVRFGNVLPIALCAVLLLAARVAGARGRRRGRS